MRKFAALRWVYATLIESALIAHDLVLPAVAAQERELYYRESRRFAALFGVPASALPPEGVPRPILGLSEDKG